jgi:hypothetical protein
VTAICFVDDVQLEAVVHGPNRVLMAPAPDSVVVIYSTIEPSSIAKIAAPAARLNIEVVYAPVSSGETGAKGKTIFYLVGGKPLGVSELLYVKCIACPQYLLVSSACDAIGRPPLRCEVRHTKLGHRQTHDRGHPGKLLLARSRRDGASQ